MTPVPIAGWAEAGAQIEIEATAVLQSLTPSNRSRSKRPLYTTE